MHKWCVQLFWCGASLIVILAIVAVEICASIVLLLGHIPFVIEFSSNFLLSLWYAYNVC